MSAPELVSTFYEVGFSVPAFEKLLRDSSVAWEQFDARDRRPSHLVGTFTAPVPPKRPWSHPNDSIVSQHGELLSPRAVQPARPADVAHEAPSTGTGWLQPPAKTPAWRWSLFNVSTASCSPTPAPRPPTTSSSLVALRTPTNLAFAQNCSGSRRRYWTCGPVMQRSPAGTGTDWHTSFFEPEDR